MIWDRKHETMSRGELEGLQLERLKTQAANVYEVVPFYRQRFMEQGVTPQAIRTLADLAKLPFTYKRDFRDNYPLGLAAVPKERIVRIHASSGTTGKPTVVAYTAGDIDTWSEVMARTITAGGVTKHDVVHNAYGYGLFTGGLGFHYGAERIGATVIPVSGGVTKRQIMLMQDLGSTVLCCTPSYALYLAEAARRDGRGSARDRPPSRHLRRGAVVGADATGDRGQAGAQGARHLRPERDHRAGGVDRMRASVRPAHLRGSLPAGDRGSGHRDAAAVGPARRAGLDDADQRGAAGHPLPHRRHHLAERRDVRVRSHDGAHGEAQRPHR